MPDGLSAADVLASLLAWFLADCRHGSATRVDLEIRDARSFRFASDGTPLNCAPAPPPGDFGAVLRANGLGLADGRCDWPLLIAGLSAFRLRIEVDRAGGREATTFVGSGRIIRAHAPVSVPVPAPVPAAAPAAALLGVAGPTGERPVGSRLSGRLRPALGGDAQSPDVLTALRAVAAAWPEGRAFLRLPPGSHAGGRHR